ncbi:MAG: FAD-dependent oxidoreductase [Burkholderiaceae bacterium]
MTQTSTDVLIVGAGPCGLLLALELGRRGIHALVVDRESTVATAPQANATQARSMEHYRRLGFADEIRAQGMPGDHPTDVAYFTTYAGYELGRHRMPCADEASARVREIQHVWNGAELPHRIAQSLVEQTLLRHARALASVQLRFDTELTGLCQDRDGVEATVVALPDGRAETVRARYLFAADGSQSTVRRLLGIALAGDDPRSRDFMGGRMLSIYVDAPAFYELGIERAWMYWTFNRRRRALLATVDGRGAFALHTQLRPTEVVESLTERDARALFLQAVGREIPFEITGMAAWLAGRALVADRFAQGRVYLGGDAAHLFTPTGGMGYNTAIEDAANIGWKLAAVLKGQADPALLDSYEIERRPIAIRNTRFALAFADSVGLYVPSPAIEQDGPAGAAARARAGAYLRRHAEREFTIAGFTFGARIDGSPVIVADDAPIPPDSPNDFVPTGKPGGRAPHVWLADGRSLFDAFGFEWTLLWFGGGREVAGRFEAEAMARGLGLTLLDLRDEPVACDLYEADLALIRPDQIVAWRGGNPGPAEVADVLDVVTALRRPGA